MVREPVVAQPRNKTLFQMIQEVQEHNVDMGWREGDTRFAEYVALLHSEVSEMLEAWRDHKRNEYTTPEGKPDDVGSEIADVFIRLLDMCDVYGYNLEHEYERKMKYNRTRAYQHGGRTL